ncbi:MAG TPA: SRPBCC domain-containing protein [Stellaceae bacterium]|nr:SRPBCC domain-containing protein [Stellaceae bacterium]
MTDTRTLVIEREIPHPAEKVWRALSQGHLVAEWLLPNDFRPDVGHRFTLRAPPMPQWDGVVHCEVLSVEALKHLSYSWTVGAMETVVTFTLTPTAQGVHLRMEQSGFRPDQDANYKGANYGWQRFLANLEKLVAGLE